VREGVKKIFKLAVFGAQVNALLIDFYQHTPAALRRLPF
jgi:hypothetical protein